MSSATFGNLLALTALAFAGGGLVWLLRSGLRRSRLLRAIVAIAAVLLTIEIGFLLMFLVALSNIPDLHDF